MKRLSCTTPRYDRLYARWLEKPGALLDDGNYAPGMKLLDLCGGTGAVTREALRRGADPSTLTLLDLNPRWDSTVPVRLVQGRAEDLDYLLRRETFDLIVCRQAIAYVDFTPQFVRDVRSRLRPGGKFVFNSFLRPKWALKTYSYEGRRYYEASGWIGQRVFHLQGCRGEAPDVTMFRWHSKEAIAAVLQEAGSLKMDGRFLSTSQRWIVY